ncbi:hypothetical protein NQ314_003890 [Rhamnusium bicolor]|uniref:Uncharacterized protein n=1 Tax=Rhamnusium bicolor TaxID=1586634 RepID=A0AAV8ZN34_9CUCU|nr:hypothetical protein NQ314_003890 [Rhamnusium bicolor]
MLIAFYLKIFLVVIGILCSRVGFYILVMSYVWMGYSTNTELVFYILSVFKDLRHTLGIIIPYGMGRAAELYSALVRINKVIQAEELPPKVGTDEPTLKPLIELKEATVHINDYIVLKNISFRTDSGLTLVTGTVGSGKSSLLKTILQDYPLTSGNLITHGRISYASQDPWLFPSSIKQNILFGEKFDQQRYQDVVRVCALQYDFNLFDKGDETIVSDRGLNLSKGQQARINLARAIYKESEIYLLDDSLTALDAHVQDYIFNECIKKYLRDKICILVTQTASHIQEVDNVVIMHKAQIKSIGKPDEKIIQVINELICKDDDLEKEILEEHEAEENEEKGEESKLIESEQITKRKVYSEVNKIGEVDFAVYKKYFIFGGGFFMMFIIVVLFGVTQGTESYSDKLITKWVDAQQKVLDLETNFTRYVQTEEDTDNFNIANNSTFGNESFIISLEEARENEKFTINLYSIMIVVSTVLGLIKTYALLDFCRKASINIHKTLSHTIINAVMSFFDSHFIGNILNRFSQDLNNIDEHLPFIFSECFRVAFSVGGIVFLMATVNWRFLIPFAVFFAILTLLRKFYLPTGRSLKRLEAASTSAGNVGLVLTQVFMLAGHVQWGVRQWADLENLMTSVERVLEYTEIKQEVTGGATVKNWPSQGAISYENVTLTYNNNEHVLKNLNFTVQPKQKIGITLEINDSGSNFSSGQKQLICLARAVIRKTKIVILDEATANMDHETDALLHDTIKENFSDCTVFTIAHRLHSILECDKVLVLDRGEIKEFDDPLSLLENKDGIFYKMVEQAGLLNYLS